MQAKACACNLLPSASWLLTLRYTTNITTRGMRANKVHVNGDFETGKPLHVAAHWDMDDLLNAASQRLNLVPTARRIFNANGLELDDVVLVWSPQFAKPPSFVLS